MTKDDSCRRPGMCPDNPLTDKMLEARERGYAAGIQGVGTRACPYNKLTAESKEWHLWHAMGVELITGVDDVERQRLRAAYRTGDVGPLS